MDSQLQMKLHELYELLDNLDCIKNLEQIKNNLDDELIDLINDYRLNPTVEKKKKLYQNNLFLAYIKNETELNYLIMEINSKFKRESGHCESN